MAWPTSKPIFAIKFSYCFSTGPEGALEASENLANQKIYEKIIAKQSKSKGEPQRDDFEVERSRRFVKPGQTKANGRSIKAGQPQWPFYLHWAAIAGMRGVYQRLGRAIFTKGWQSQRPSA